MRRTFRSFAPLLVRNTNHADVLDVLVSEQVTFKLSRSDLKARHLDELLEAIGDEEEAFLVEVRLIARVQEAVGIECLFCRFLVSEVCKRCVSLI